MTVTCPVCGHESDREWRCEQCQKDLVEESDGPERPLRADGSGEYYVRDASEDKIVAGPFLAEPIALLTARVQGVDCAVVPRSELDVDAIAADPHPATDGGAEPHVADCRHCGFRRTYEGTRWRLPVEQAEQSIGGHHTHSPDHVVDVYAESERVPERVHFAASRNAAQRTLHVAADCRALADAGSVSSAPATHPPRGNVCGHCGRGLGRSDLVESGGGAQSIATDGGKPISAYLGPERHRCDICHREFEDLSELRQHDCRRNVSTQDILSGSGPKWEREEAKRLLGELGVLGNPSTGMPATSRDEAAAAVREAGN